jgi:hypothetical protein
MSHAADTHPDLPLASSTTHASLPLSAPAAADVTGGCRSVLGTYPECPMCGGGLFPEHAHFKCSACGWRDSCCD